jgi:hypothetical protein
VIGGLYHVDGLTLCLNFAVDEQGNRLTCPITLNTPNEECTKNVALIQDGGVYQMGAITTWFAHGKTLRP